MQMQLNYGDRAEPVFISMDCDTSVAKCKQDGERLSPEDAISCVCDSLNSEGNSERKVEALSRLEAGQKSNRMNFVTITNQVELTVEDRVDVQALYKFSLIDMDPYVTQEAA